MKLRVKHIEGLGYFAQVKSGLLSGWKTIGKHITGFGEYPEICIDHPLEKHSDALDRLEEYKKWLYIKNQKPEYQHFK